MTPEGIAISWDLIHWEADPYLNISMTTLKQSVRRQPHF